MRHLRDRTVPATIDFAALCRATADPAFTLVDTAATCALWKPHAERMRAEREARWAAEASRRTHSDG